MPDLRDELGRLADFVGEPVGLDDLATVRRRRERRRRTAGLVAGLAVIAAATVFLATTFRSSQVAPMPGTSGSTGGTYEPPAVPYLWPENWAVPADDPAETQSRVDSGVADVQWRTDPGQVIDRFVHEILGWQGSTGSVVESFGSKTGGVQVWDVHPACSDASACDPASTETIRLVQPEIQGSGGIWAVQRVDGGLELGLGDADSAPTIVPSGSQLSVNSNLPPMTLATGLIASNGCVSVGGGQDIGQFAQVIVVPGLGGSADRAGDCGDRGAGYAYVYSVRDGIPLGEPFVESQAMVALTMVPFILDGGVPAIPPTPSAAHGGADCSTPLSDTTLVIDGLLLSGCAEWSAGTPIRLTVDDHDVGIPVKLALYPKSACTETSGCVGHDIWSDDVRTGRFVLVDRLPSLDPGTYELIDQIHPGTSRIEIHVG
jgi:hypothetical protein